MAKKTLKKKEMPEAEELPTPAKSDPGSRARQFLTPEQADELTEIAQMAAEIRKDKTRNERRERFKDLAGSSGMRHETLLKWGRLFEAFGSELSRHLVELGKSKLYILAYAKKPGEALGWNIPARDNPGRVLPLREASAEDLRHYIRRKQRAPRGPAKVGRGKRRCPVADPEPASRGRRTGSSPLEPEPEGEGTAPPGSTAGSSSTAPTTGTAAAALPPSRCPSAVLTAGRSTRRPSLETLGPTVPGVSPALSSFLPQAPG